MIVPYRCLCIIKTVIHVKMKVIDAKIVVLGSQGVGKTSMVVRYIGKMFSKHISPTIGASFFTCKINLPDATVKLQVWDTAGQERFRSMAPMYYRNANAALLVYDISNAQSFRDIKGWVKELQSNVEQPMVLVLVGNKSDLSASRRVTKAEADSFAECIGATHLETSALTDQGIEQVFLSTAHALLEFGAHFDYEHTDSYTHDRDMPQTTNGSVELPHNGIENLAHGEPMHHGVCC